MMPHDMQPPIVRSACPVTQDPCLDPRCGSQCERLRRKKIRKAVPDEAELPACVFCQTHAVVTQTGRPTCLKCGREQPLPDVMLRATKEQGGTYTIRKATTMEPVMVRVTADLARHLMVVVNGSIDLMTEATEQDIHTPITTIEVYRDDDGEIVLRATDLVNGFRPIGHGATLSEALHRLHDVVSVAEEDGWDYP